MCCRLVTGMRGTEQSRRFLFILDQHKKDKSVARALLLLLHRPTSCSWGFVFLVMQLTSQTRTQRNEVKKGKKKKKKKKRESWRVWISWRVKSSEREKSSSHRWRNPISQSHMILYRYVAPLFPFHEIEKRRAMLYSKNCYSTSEYDGIWNSNGQEMADDVISSFDINPLLLCSSPSLLSCVTRSKTGAPPLVCG